MTTTAVGMIKRSMRLAGSIGVGEEPTDDEAQDGLTALNSMLGSLSTERQASAYYVVEETLTLTNATEYTVGPSGDLNTTRPSRIEDSNFIRYGSGSSAYDLPITLLNYEAYAAIVAKGITSNMAFYMFVSMENPLVKLKFYPIPTGSGGVLHLFSWKQLQQFSTLTTALSLPIGYEEMIVSNLAIRWAGPEFGLVPPKAVQDLAVRSLAAIKRINATSPIARSEAGLMTRQWAQQGSIYWGGSP